MKKHLPKCKATTGSMWLPEILASTATEGIAICRVDVDHIDKTHQGLSGTKLVKLIFKPGRMQRGAHISVCSSEGCCGQPEVALCHQYLQLLGGAGGPKLLLGSSAPLQSDAGHVPPLG